MDSKRSKIFSKIIKDITVAVKEGGNDIDGNARLRLAIANAKGVNMPKETLQRAINKASDKNTATLNEMSFECYAQHGVAVFVECLTDNNNRTVATIRSILNKFGGSLGTNGSLNFIFARKGVFEIPVGNKVIEELEMALIDAGAEEIEMDEDYITAYCQMEDFGNMQKALEQAGIEAESAELQRIPNTTISVEQEDAKKIMRMINLIEDDDDVRAVYHNMEMNEELLEE